MKNIKEKTARYRVYSDVCYSDFTRHTHETTFDYYESAKILMNELSDLFAREMRKKYVLDYRVMISIIYE